MQRMLEETEFSKKVDCHLSNEDYIKEKWRVKTSPCFPALPVDYKGVISHHWQDRSVPSAYAGQKRPHDRPFEARRKMNTAPAS